jgi:hypothetical protein
LLLGSLGLFSPAPAQCKGRIRRPHFFTNFRIAGPSFVFNFFSFWKSWKKAAFQKMKKIENAAGAGDSKVWKKVGSPNPALALSWGRKIFAQKKIAKIFSTKKNGRLTPTREPDGQSLS